MFDKLTQKINRQNLAKIRAINNKSLEKNNHQEIYDNDNDSLSLSDVDIELEQREQNFNRIMTATDTFGEYYIKKNDHFQTPPSLLRKYQSQIQLSNQKLKLQQQTHKKEIDCIRQIHTREKQFLQAENHRLTLELTKQKNIRSNTSTLKNEIACLIQINETLKKRCEEKQGQVSKMKIQILNFHQNHMKIAEKKHNHQKNDVIMISLSQMQKKLEQIYEDRDHWKENCEKKNKNLQKITHQLSKIKEQNISKEKNFESLIQSLKYDYQNRIQFLQRQYEKMQKRNTQLEQVLINKLEQMTKLQATFVSHQTSVSSNHLLIKQIEQGQQTLNLQQESPIRPKMQENHSLRLNETRKNRIQSAHPELVNNPQINTVNKYNDKNHDYRQEIVLNSRMRQKLTYANKKIIELIEQKIKQEKVINDLKKKLYCEKS